TESSSPGFHTGELTNQRRRPLGTDERCPIFDNTILDLSNSQVRPAHVVENLVDLFL
ncbi:unnamed protein product, partial [Ceratitis capitata]